MYAKETQALRFEARSVFPCFEIVFQFMRLADHTCSTLFRNSPAKAHGMQAGSSGLIFLAGLREVFRTNRPLDGERFPLCPQTHSMVIRPKGLLT